MPSGLAGSRGASCAGALTWRRVAPTGICTQILIRELLDETIRTIISIVPRRLVSRLRRLQVELRVLLGVVLVL